MAGKLPPMIDQATSSGSGSGGGEGPARKSRPSKKDIAAEVAKRAAKGGGGDKPEASTIDLEAIKAATAGLENLKEEDLSEADLERLTAPSNTAKKEPAPQTIAPEPEPAAETVAGTDNALSEVAVEEPATAATDQPENAPGAAAINESAQQNAVVDNLPTRVEKARKELMAAADHPDEHEAITFPDGAFSFQHDPEKPATKLSEDERAEVRANFLTGLSVEDRDKVDAAEKKKQDMVFSLEEADAILSRTGPTNAEQRRLRSAQNAEERGKDAWRADLKLTQAALVKMVEERLGVNVSSLEEAENLTAKALEAPYDTYETLTERVGDGEGKGKVFFKESKRGPQLRVLDPNKNNSELAVEVPAGMTLNPGDDVFVRITYRHMPQEGSKKESISRDAVVERVISTPSGREAAAAERRADEEARKTRAAAPSNLPISGDTSVRARPEAGPNPFAVTIENDSSIPLPELVARAQTKFEARRAKLLDLFKRLSEASLNVSEYYANEAPAMLKHQTDGVLFPAQHELTQMMLGRYAEGLTTETAKNDRRRTLERQVSRASETLRERFNDALANLKLPDVITESTELEQLISEYEQAFDGYRRDSIEQLEALKALAEEEQRLLDPESAINKKDKLYTEAIIRLWEKAGYKQSKNSVRREFMFRTGMAQRPPLHAPELNAEPGSEQEWEAGYTSKKPEQVPEAEAQLAWEKTILTLWDTYKEQITKALGDETVDAGVIDNLAFNNALQDVNDARDHRGLPPFRLEQEELSARSIGENPTTTQGSTVRPLDLIVSPVSSSELEGIIAQSHKEARAELLPIEVVEEDRDKLTAELETDLRRAIITIKEALEKKLHLRPFADEAHRDKYLTRLAARVLETVESRGDDAKSYADFKRENPTGTVYSGTILELAKELNERKIGGHADVLLDDFMKGTLVAAAERLETGGLIKIGEPSKEEAQKREAGVDDKRWAERTQELAQKYFQLLLVDRDPAVHDVTLHEYAQDVALNQANERRARKNLPALTPSVFTESLGRIPSLGTEDATKETAEIRKTWIERTQRLAEKYYANLRAESEDWVRDSTLTNLAQDYALEQANIRRTKKNLPTLGYNDIF